MMKPIASIYFVVSFLLFVTVSCKKKCSNVTGGGKGGSVIIKITPEHESHLVDSSTVYIKYGYTSSTPPANGVYDDSVVCVLVDSLPVATFSNLTTGNYYFLAKGRISSISPPTVEGALPITICNDGDYSYYLSTGQYYP